MSRDPKTPRTWTMLVIQAFAVLLVTLTVYVVSVGPLVAILWRLGDAGYLPDWVMPVYVVVYKPLEILCTECKPIGDVIEAYVEWCIRMMEFIFP